MTRPSSPPTPLGKLLTGPLAVLLPALVASLESQLRDRTPAELAAALAPAMLTKTPPAVRAPLGELLLALGARIAQPELDHVGE